MGTWGDSCWNLTERLHREVMRCEPKTFHPLHPSRMFTASKWNLTARKMQKNFNDTINLVESAGMAHSRLPLVSTALQGLRNSPRIYFGICHFFWLGCVCLSCTQNAVALKASSDEWKAKQKRFACGMIESLESIKSETSERIVVNNSTAFNRHQLIVFLFIARNNIFCRFHIRRV